MIDFNTSAIIVLYYPPFAGGKFISNCLALSRSALVQDHVLADLDIYLQKTFSNYNLKEYLDNLYLEIAGSDWPSLENYCNNTESDKIDQKELIIFRDRLDTISKVYKIYKNLPTNAKYYDFKRELITISLPNKDEISRWRKYEFGCAQFFGCDAKRYNSQYNNIVKVAISKKLNFFKVAHSHQDLIDIISLWKNAKIIELVNYKNFQELAVKLKNKDVTPLIKSNKELITLPSIKIDIDDIIFNKQKFSTRIKDLYQQLEYDDFNQENIEIFYDKYISLHRN